MPTSCTNKSMNCYMRAENRIGLDAHIMHQQEYMDCYTRAKNRIELDAHIVHQQEYMDCYTRAKNRIGLDAHIMHQQEYMDCYMRAKNRIGLDAHIMHQQEYMDCYMRAKNRIGLDAHIMHQQEYMDCYTRAKNRIGLDAHIMHQQEYMDCYTRAKNRIGLDAHIMHQQEYELLHESKEPNRTGCPHHAPTRVWTATWEQRTRRDWSCDWLGRSFPNKNWLAAISMAAKSSTARRRSLRSPCAARLHSGPSWHRRISFSPRVYGLLHESKELDRTGPVTGWEGLFQQELACCNFYGGEVFNGMEKIVKEPLCSKIAFMAIMAQMEIVFPKSIWTATQEQRTG